MDNLDYYKVLAPWRDVFGQKNIIVRVYEKEQLTNGIFWDFLYALNLEMNESFKIPSRKLGNPSINWDLIEMIRLCNIRLRGQKKIFPFLILLIEILEKMHLWENNPKNFLLSPQQRRDFLEQFDESNAKIAVEYLGRTDGRLFYAPLPNSDERWEPYEGLTAKSCIRIIIRVPFAVFTQVIFIAQSKFQKLCKNSKTKENGIY